jgi:hypothetical protein
MIAAVRSWNVRLQALVAAACVVASLVAASCGSKDKGQPPSSVALSTDPNIVTSGDISRAPAHSPRRALLTWFQAVQFRDVAEVRQLTAPANVIRVTQENLDRAVTSIGASLARPQIVHTRITGDKASVRVLLLSYKPGSTLPVASLPATFSLLNTAGSWLVSDVSVLFPNGVPAYQRHGR